MTRTLAILVMLLGPGSAALSQQVANDDYTYGDGVLVTSADVLTCPYSFIQPVTVNVTEDYGADSRAKIFGKFRVEAKKLGADAVVLVGKGNQHLTAWAWHRRSYTGRAIRYINRQCAPNH